MTLHIDFLYAAVAVFAAAVVSVIVAEAWMAHKRENARRYS